MKNRSLKYLLLIISFGHFSTKLFAQIPAYPGGDPMEPDSAKYIVPLKPADDKLLISPSGVLPSTKGKDSNDKTIGKVQLNKKEEEDKRVIF